MSIAFTIAVCVLFYSVYIYNLELFYNILYTYIQIWIINLRSHIILQFVYFLVRGKNNQV